MFKSGVFFSFRPMIANKKTLHPSLNDDELGVFQYLDRDKLAIVHHNP